MKQSQNSLFFITFALKRVLRIIVLFMFMFAVYFFLRGHNAPGGGFIAGVVLSIGVVFVYIVMGDTYMKLLRFEPMKVCGAGIALALITAFVPLLLQDPFLTHYMTYISTPIFGKLHIGTPLLFDLGIMMCVSGMIIQTIIVLSQFLLEEAE
jgi:multisubunit Na+/H+ antiporter MnhB subunit